MKVNGSGTGYVGNETLKNDFDFIYFQKGKMEMFLFHCGFVVFEEGKS